MFGFLNSAILFAGLAALIPLIIHLFSRRRVKIVEFSSLKHLFAMQKRQVRRLKIRQLLLLLLRMLIILAVVAAFARPTSNSGVVGSHAAVSAVILFDNSASMHRHVVDGNLFEIARKRTAQLLATFGESDEVLFMPLISDEATDGAQLFGSVARANNQLERIKPAFGAPHFESSLERSASALASAKNLKRRLEVGCDDSKSDSCCYCSCAC